MSSVDERIVEMQFDNKDFENGVKETLRTLEVLKEQLNFNGVADTANKQLATISKAADTINLDGLNDAIDKLNYRFSTLGVIATTALSNITNSLLNFGKNTIGGIFSQILQGGTQRAANIEQAEFMLEGLGLNVEKAMQNANDAVTDTAYGLDQAAKAAGQLAASGIKLGTEMTSTLQGIAGVAAMTGRDYDNIASIFETIAGNGRIMGMQLTQLSSAGLNVAKDMADFFNGIVDGSEEASEATIAGVANFLDAAKITGKVAEADIRDAASRGLITSQMFFDTMTAKYAEHAKDANKTYTGALSNFKAALSRIGAEFVMPWRDNMREFYNAVTPVINSIKKSMDGVYERFRWIVNMFGKISKKKLDIFKYDKDHNLISIAGKDLKDVQKLVGDLARGPYRILKIIINQVVRLGKVAKSILPTPSFEKFAEVIDKISHAIPYFNLNLAASGEYSTKFGTNIEDAFGGIVSLIDMARIGLKNLVKIVAPLFSWVPSAIKAIAKGLGSIGKIFTGLDEKLKDFDSGKGSKIVNNISKVTKTIGNILKSFFDFLAGDADFTLFSKIGEGFEAIKGIIANANIDPSAKLSEIATKLKELGPIAGIITIFRLALDKLKNGIVGFVDKIKGFKDKIKVFEEFKDKIKNLKGFEKFKALSEKFGVLQTIVLDVVSAIASLIDKIKALNTHSSKAEETAENVKGSVGVWGKIVDGLSKVIEFFIKIKDILSKSFGDAWKKATNTLGDAGNTIGGNIVKIFMTIFGGIKDVVKTVFKSISSYFKKLFSIGEVESEKGAEKLLTPWQKFKKALVKVFTGIGNIIRDIVIAIKTVFGSNESKNSRKAYTTNFKKISDNLSGIFDNHKNTNFNRTIQNGNSTLTGWQKFSIIFARVVKVIAGVIKIVKNVVQILATAQVTATLAVFTTKLPQLMKALSKFFKQSNGLVNILSYNSVTTATAKNAGKNMAALCALIGTITASLFVISLIPVDNLIPSLIAVSSFLAFSVVLLKILQKFVTTSNVSINREGLKVARSNFASLTSAIIGMGVSVLLMASAFAIIAKVVNTVDPEAFDTALSTVGLISAILAASIVVINRAMEHKDSKSAAKNVRSAGAAMWFMALGIKNIAKSIKIIMDAIGEGRPEDYNKLTSAVVAISTVIFELIAFASIIGNKGQYMGRVGASMIEMSVALLIITSVIAIFGKMKPETLVQGTMSFIEIFGIIVLFSKLLQNKSKTNSFGDSKKTNYDGIAKMAASMLILATAMLLLTSVVAIFGKMKPETYTKGLIAIGILFAGITTLVKIVGSVNDRKLKQVPLAVLSVSAVLLAIALAIKIANSMPTAQPIKTAVAFAISLGALIAALKVLGESSGIDITDIGETLLSLAAIVMLMVPLSTSLAIAGSSGNSIKSAVALAISLGAVVAALLVLDKNEVSDIKKVGTIILAIAGIAGSMYIISLALKKLDGSTSPFKNFAVISLGLAAIIGALLLLSKTTKDVDKLKATAESIFFVSAAIMLIAIALKEVPSVDDGLISSAMSLFAMLGAITVSLMLLKKNSSDVIAAAASIAIISAALLVFAGALKIVDSLQSALKDFTIISIALAELTAVLIILSEMEIEFNPTKLIGVSAALIIASGALVIFAGALQLIDSLENAWQDFAIIAGGLAAITVALIAFIAVCGTIGVAATPAIAAIDGLIAAIAGIIGAIAALALSVAIVVAAVTALAKLANQIAETANGFEGLRNNLYSLITAIGDAIVDGITDIGVKILENANKLYSLFYATVPDLVAKFLGAIKVAIDMEAENVWNGGGIGGAIMNLISAMVFTMETYLGSLLSDSGNPITQWLGKQFLEGSENVRQNSSIFREQGKADVEEYLAGRQEVLDSVKTDNTDTSTDSISGLSDTLGASSILGDLTEQGTSDGADYTKAFKSEVTGGLQNGNSESTEAASIFGSELSDAIGDNFDISGITSGLGDITSAFNITTEETTKTKEESTKKLKDLEKEYSDAAKKYNAETGKSYEETDQAKSQLAAIEEKRNKKAIKSMKKNSGSYKKFLDDRKKWEEEFGTSYAETATGQTQAFALAVELRKKAAEQETEWMKQKYNEAADAIEEEAQAAVDAANETTVGETLTTTTANGITDGTNNVAVAAMNMTNSVGDSAASNMQSKGETATNNFLSGMLLQFNNSPMITALMSKARSTGQNMVDNLNEGLGNASPSKKTALSGKNLILGLVKGVSENAFKATNEAVKMASGVTAAVNGEFEINSPSKKFQKIGEYLTHGLIKGINNTTPKLYTTIKTVGKGMTKALKAATKDGASSSIIKSLKKITKSEEIQKWYKTEYQKAYQKNLNTSTKGNKKSNKKKKPNKKQKRQAAVMAAQAATNKFITSAYLWETSEEYADLQTDNKENKATIKDAKKGLKELKKKYKVKDSSTLKKKRDAAKKNYEKLKKQYKNASKDDKKRLKKQLDTAKKEYKQLDNGVEKWKQYRDDIKSAKEDIKSNNKALLKGYTSYIKEWKKNVNDEIKESLTNNFVPEIKKAFQVLSVTIPNSADIMIGSMNKVIDILNLASSTSSSTLSTISSSFSKASSLISESASGINLFDEMTKEWANQSEIRLTMRQNAEDYANYIENLSKLYTKVGSEAGGDALYDMVKSMGFSTEGIAYLNAFLGMTASDLKDAINSVNSMADTATKEYLSNYESTLDEYDKWQSGLSKLLQNGKVDAAIIEALRDGGVSTLNQVEYILNMTDSELESLNKLYSKEAANNVKEYFANVQSSMKTYQEWVSNMDELEKLAADTGNNLSEDFVNKVKSMGVEGAEYVKGILSLKDDLSALNSIGSLYEQEKQIESSQYIDTIETSVDDYYTYLENLRSLKNKVSSELYSDLDALGYAGSETVAKFAAMDAETLARAEEAYEKSKQINAANYINDMRTQLTTYQDYINNLKILQEKGISKTLIKQFQESGVDAAEQVSALVYAIENGVNGVTVSAINEYLTTSQQMSANAWINNLKATEDDYKELYSGLATLKAKGLASGLVEQFKEMGTEALPYIRSFLADVNTTVAAANAAYKDEQKMTKAQMLLDMKAEQEKAKTWAANIKKMAQKGYDVNFIQNLVNQGYEATSEQVALYADMSDEEIAATNTMWNDIESISKNGSQKVLNAINYTFTNEGEAKYNELEKKYGSKLNSTISSLMKTMGLEDSNWTVLTDNWANIGDSTSSEFISAWLAAASSDEISSQANSAGSGIASTVSNGAISNTDAASTAGKTLADALTSSLNSSLTINAIVKRKLVFSDATIKKANNQGAKIGKNIGKGIVSGIKNKKSNITAAAESVAKAALKAAKKALGIKSPSKEFMKVGNYIGEGFIIGMESMEASVGESADGLALTTLDAVYSTMSDLKGISSEAEIAPSITPVFDSESAVRGLEALDTLTMDRSTTLATMSLNNADQINAINTLRTELNTLSDKIASMADYTDAIDTIQAMVSTYLPDAATDVYIDGSKLTTYVENAMANNIVRRRAGW